MRDARGSSYLPGVNFPVPLPDGVFCVRERHALLRSVRARLAVRMCVSVCKVPPPSSAHHGTAEN